MKKFVFLLIIIMTAAFYGCGPSRPPECVKIGEDTLSADAQALFASLSGERGRMLYSNAAQTSGSYVSMYAVLYGETPQDLSIQLANKTLNMEIGGEMGAGYSVWRVSYDPRKVTRAEFVLNGSASQFDGYEELPFPIELSAE